MEDKSVKGTPALYFDKVVDRTVAQTTRHYHTTYEIYYLLSGECRYFIDDRIFDVCVGDVLVIPPRIIHRTNYKSPAHGRILLNFTESYLPPSVAEKLGELDYLFRDKATSSEVLRLLTRIGEEYSSPDSLSDDLIGCYIRELLLLLARKGPDIAARPAQTNPIVEKAIKYIRENYDRELSLSEAAQLSSVSPEHLSRIFKKATGFGFSEYVTVFRLQRAENMLANEPGRSVSEVAFACGFNDSNYFSHRFCRFYGYPPSRIKRKDG